MCNVSSRIESHRLDSPLAAFIMSYRLGEKRRQECRSSVLRMVYPISINGLQIGVNQPAVLRYGVRVYDRMKRLRSMEVVPDVTIDLDRKMGGNERRDKMTRANEWFLNVNAPAFSFSKLLREVT